MGSSYAKASEGHGRTVGRDGIEPSTSSLSEKRSTSELPTPTTACRP